MKKNSDFTKILKKEHEEKWVALSENHDKVIDFSEKLADLTKRIGDRDVTYMRVLRSDTEYAF